MNHTTITIPNTLRDRLLRSSKSKYKKYGTIAKELLEQKLDELNIPDYDSLPDTNTNKDYVKNN
jgi:hypothetical protein